MVGDITNNILTKMTASSVISKTEDEVEQFVNKFEKGERLIPALSRTCTAMNEENNEVVRNAWSVQCESTFLKLGSSRNKWKGMENN